MVSGKSSKFISLSECLHWHWGSSYLLFNAYWHVFFLGTEWVGCEADQSPPSGVKVKEWIYTFTPLYAFVISQGHLYLLRDVGCEDEKRKDVAQVWAQVLVFGISNVRWVSYTNIVLTHWNTNLICNKWFQGRFITYNSIQTMYDIPFDRSFLQLSNGIRHVMPSTDKARIKSIGLDGSASHRRLCVPMG